MLLVSIFANPVHMVCKGAGWQGWRLAESCLQKEEHVHVRRIRSTHHNRSIGIVLRNRQFK